MLGLATADQPAVVSAQHRDPPRYEEVATPCSPAAVSLSHASAGAAGLYAATLVRSRLREQYAFAAEMGIAPEEAINLANNENSLGPGEAVMDALDAVIGPEGVIAGRYPFRFTAPLREAIAEKWGVKPENVLVGAGSTQILVDCTHQFVSRERALVGSLPTYEECFGYAALMGYRTKAVPLTADFKMDLDQTLHACKGSGMLFYCNPNNPVATLVDPAQGKDFLMRALDVEKNLRILVDEAYIDYVTTPGHETMIPAAIENPRLIVARTFSKAYGMAGLRVGYAIAHEDTIAELDEFHLGNLGQHPGAGRRQRRARARQGGPRLPPEREEAQRRGAGLHHQVLRRPRPERHRRPDELHLRGRGDAHRAVPGGLRRRRRPCRAAVPAALDPLPHLHRHHGRDAARRRQDGHRPRRRPEARRVTPWNAGFSRHQGRRPASGSPPICIQRATAWNAGFSRHRGPEARGCRAAVRRDGPRAEHHRAGRRSTGRRAPRSGCRLKPAFQAGGAIEAVGGPTKLHFDRNRRVAPAATPTTLTTRHDGTPVFARRGRFLHHFLHGGTPCR